MQIPGKVFVVTGGGSGIGREVAVQLTRAGARVAAVDLNADSLEETHTLAGAGDRLTIHPVNVTDADQVAALPEAVLAGHGQVDGLLNIAGIIQRFLPFAELSLADIEKVMNVNFYGVVATMKAFLPHLLQRPEAALVNVSSMGGFLPVPGQTIYGASKAAVKLMSEGMRAELQDTPVRVTIVFPGAVGTNISRNSGIDMPAADTDQAAAHKTTSAAEAAATIIKGMAKGSYHVFVGADARAMDALTRLVPERAMEIIAKRMGNLLTR
ncbi:MAG: SDR family NAD(P)-dependent oxidoreductase [Propioniciclava sp.]